MPRRERGGRRGSGDENVRISAKEIAQTVRLGADAAAELDVPPTAGAFESVSSLSILFVGSNVICEPRRAVDGKHGRSRHCREGRRRGQRRRRR